MNQNISTSDWKQLAIYKSNEEYNSLKKKTLKRWKAVSSLLPFEKYFREQWLEGDFCNWQIFNSPHGFASTNNSIESFNSRIKKFFTKREKLSLSRTIDRLCDELITYYSVHKTEFKWFREPKAKDKKIALLLDKKEFQLKDSGIIIHQGKTSQHVINIDLKSCSCRWFLAYAMCAHLIRAGELYTFRIDDRERTKFVHRPNKGRKKQKSAFRQQFEHSPATGSQVSSEKPQTRKRVRQEEEEPCKEVSKRRRGPPRLARSIQQEEPSTQVAKRGRGRPRLASSALKLD